MGYIGVISYLLTIYYLPGTSKYPERYFWVDDFENFQGGMCDRSLEG